ncbi:MAG: TetR/AcrR family transcriptional regulator C-terminal domain-containing protein, partial [Stackebrandtia sp.]
AQGMRELFLAHPWALAISTRAHAIGPNETAWVETQLRAVSGLNVPPMTGLNLILTVSGFVRGAVAPELYAEAGKELRFAFLDHPETHARFPLLSEALKTPDVDADFDSFFEFGLTRVLDGIAVSFDTARLPAPLAWFSCANRHVVVT